MDVLPSKQDVPEHIPVPVEIVFQGGGAKLAALLAAASALQEADGKKIKITKITGTSAGAIAGCLLASDKTIDETVQQIWLGGKGMELINNSKPPWWGKNWARLDYWRNQRLPTALLKFWKWKELVSNLNELGKAAKTFSSGTPLWNTAPFEMWLQERLGIHVRLDSLDPPVEVTRTDLKACLSEKVKDGIAWKEAINSAAFPFLLRLWHEGYVDGGICENLPSQLETPWTQKQSRPLPALFLTRQSQTPSAVRRIRFHWSNFTPSKPPWRRLNFSGLSRRNSTKLLIETTNLNSKG